MKRFDTYGEGATTSARGRQHSIERKLKGHMQTAQTFPPFMGALKCARSTPRTNTHFIPQFLARRLRQQPDFHFHVGNLQDDVEED